MRSVRGAHCGRFDAAIWGGFVDAEFSVCIPIGSVSWEFCREICLFHHRRLRFLLDRSHDRSAPSARRAGLAHALAGDRCTVGPSALSQRPCRCGTVGSGFFGAQVQCLAGASNAGRLCVPLRIVIALLYAKQLFNQSDEGVVERCAGTPRWQLFSGGADDEHLSACEARTFGQAPPIAVRRRSGRAADADHQGRCRSQADQTAGARLRIRAPDTRGAGLSGRGGGQAPCAYRAGDRTHLAGWRATTPQTSC